MSLLEILSAQSGLSQDDVARIAATAPRRYKVYEIPKRGGGVREIAQPAREVKLLQRILIDVLLASLPVHDAARAYRKGLSIKDNALEHEGAGPILKMDFKDFFPSIRSEDWKKYCDNSSLLEGPDIALSSQILFRRSKGERYLKLSIGAPSSPMLSNILMHEFDGIVSNECSRKGIRYTRYADDLTFSGQRIGMLKDMLGFIDGAVRRMEFPRLTVNQTKTTFVTSSTRRTVTGVVLTNQAGSGLGRDKRRLISSQVHHASIGTLNKDEYATLAGNLGLVKVIEPAFLDKLMDKYGITVIKRIKKLAHKPD